MNGHLKTFKEQFNENIATKFPYVIWVTLGSNQYIYKRVKRELYQLTDYTRDDKWIPSSGVPPRTYKNLMDRLNEISKMGQSELTVKSLSKKQFMDEWTLENI